MATGDRNGGVEMDDISNVVAHAAAHTEKALTEAVKDMRAQGLVAMTK